MDLYIKFFFRISTLFLVINNYLVNSHSCTKKSSCSCHYSSGELIDLSPLSSTTNDPTFLDIDGPGADSFSFNPCKPFNESDCVKVSVCNIHQNIPDAVFIPIGTEDTAAFSFNDKGQLQLTYDFIGGDGAKRSSFIALLCDKSQEGSLNPLGENPAGSGLYYFELTSKYACHSGSSITVGTVICIIFVSVVLLYLVLGIVFNVFVRRHRGKDVLPNRTFWASTPGLVKDGVVFVVSRGKSSNYSKI